MTRGERLDALHVDIYAEIGYQLGIDDSDDAACDAKNRAALGVLRLIERELACECAETADRIEARHASRLEES